jgi:hypothetical protein
MENGVSNGVVKTESVRVWMDGWILFRPEALSLKGLGTLITNDSSASPKISHKPFEMSSAQSFPIPLASCLDC